ncbi:uncharacterized protein [Narcine bancroftii]|uniref:uncharacterized protein isoform X4 n=1 Tax=Narcine bancroftii TaxID=1343680 RepID=UPI003831BD46
MQHRGCLQVAMDAVVGRRGSGQGSGVAVPALKQVALLLHLLIVVGAAPRPDCATGNTTGFRGERHITPAVGCTNLVETKLNFNLTLSHSNVTGASQDKDLDQTMGEPAPVKPAESVPQVDDQVTSDAQQSAGGSSTTARQSTKRKKDLGVLDVWPAEFVLSPRGGNNSQQEELLESSQCPGRERWRSCYQRQNNLLQVCSCCLALAVGTSPGVDKYSWEGLAYCSLKSAFEFVINICIN